MLKKRRRVSSQQQQPPVARKAKDAGSGGSAPVTVHAADTNAAPAESEKSAQTELGCETHESSDHAGTPDFFHSHFGADISNLDLRIAAIRSKQCKASQFIFPSTLGNVTVLEPAMGTEDRSSASAFVEAPDGHLQWEKLHVKSRIREPFVKLNQSIDSSQIQVDVEQSPPLSQLQAHIFSVINSYTDMLFTQQTHANSKEIRHIIAIHAVNHILKTRDRILKNNEKIKSLDNPELQDTLSLEDQGFTRPKILILTPLKNSAYEIINDLISLSGSTQQENKSRYKSEFDADSDDEMDPKKPADFQLDFRGNIDDCFRIGVKFSRKHLKLFADFYSSDIIVASPLGLRMVIGAEGDKSRDFDFLSSIEVVILDHTDFFLMQNWDHIEHIFDHINLIPKESHGCDFSRTKKWYLDGQAKFVRQTLIFAHFNSPEINSLWTRCQNVSGRIKTGISYSGTMSDIVVKMSQMFFKIPCSSLMTADDERFKYFTLTLLPKLIRPGEDPEHTLIFIPSYFDFVRVRNYLNDKSFNFGQLSEYSPTPDVSRTRGNFFHGKLGLVLYTERFHFFRRYIIRGIRNLVFYGLPDHASFYPELVNSIEKADVVSCYALYCKYDQLKLERIVGSHHVQKMMEKETFLFA